MRNKTTRLPIPLALACSLLLAGCSAASTRTTPSTSPAPDAGRSLVAAPEATATACFNSYAIGEPYPKTIAMQASLSRLIVIGTYEGAGESFWTTPGHAPPSTAREALRAQIHTRIAITPRLVVRGSAMSPQELAVAGGSVGCSTERYSPDLNLEPGVTYLFFGTGPGHDAATNTTEHVLYTAWLVSTGDMVLTPDEGAQPLPDVLAAVADHPVVGRGSPLPFPAPDAGSVIAPSPDNGP